MTVSVDARVETRPFSGFNDPALPTGSYIAQVGVAGDASGGIVLIDFEFMNEGNPLNNQMYNLEQISIDTSTAASEVFEMETLNMDRLAPTRGASPKKWRWVTSAGIAASMLPVQQLSGLPLWLGAPNQEAPSGSALLRFNCTNTDLRLYAITIEGYIWGPRSVLAPGGPQRPARGFMRS